MVEDEDGMPLGYASLLFVPSNGDEFGPFKTNASGLVSRSQGPVGTYGLTVPWRGIDVFTGTKDGIGNGIISSQRPCTGSRPPP